MSDGEGLEPPGPLDDATDRPPTKVCPSCSVQSITEGSFCPHCGASFVREGSNRGRSRRLLIIAVVAVLVCAGGVAGFLKLQSDRDAETAAAATQQEALEEAAAQAAASAAAEAEEEAAEVAAEQAAEAAREQAAADERERARRADIVIALEESIQEDAEERVSAGELEGPILRTSCTPVGGGSVDDLTAITGNFECIAVNEEDADGTASGWRFTATIEWAAASYQWRLGG